MRNTVNRPARPHDLSASVGSMMRPTLTVDESSSLARAADVFRENGASVLPVVDAGGRLVGVLTESEMAVALAEMESPTDPVSGFVKSAETIEPYATAAEALRRVADGGARVVVDDGGRAVGLVSAIDLWPHRRMPPRPAMVGGMATPFGVYLTTGAVSAGARWWGLMATGAAMFTLLLLSASILSFAGRHGLPEWAVRPGSIALWLTLLRLSPLSGTHGAEHQVVNAIEREEVLVPSAVRRMSRVHPRCGTNVAVGVSLFLALFTVTATWLQEEELRVVLSLIVVAVAVMPLGSLMQKYVTTKRPNERQLKDAIAAAEALLKTHAGARYSRPKVWQRVWNMGMLQVMAGALLTELIVQGLASLFHFEILL